MAHFEYRGRDPQGITVSGRMEALSAEAVAGQLMGRGVTPTIIDEVVDSLTFTQRIRRLFGWDAIKREELILFTRQMYTISKAGIPLIQGIRGLGQTIKHYRLKKCLDDIADRLESGSELSTALRHHTDVFDGLYISMVHVGENSGRLEEIFDQLSEYQQRDLETRKSIKSALRYPFFVVIALSVALAVVNIKVIPAFAAMFEKFGSQLPLMTRVLIEVSNISVTYWPHLLGALFLLAWGGKRYIRTEQGQRYWGRFKLNIPVVGSIIERGLMARYARSFALMLKSGVPVTHSLELCANAVDNPYVGDRIQTIRTGIERGDSLLRTHTSSQLFTPLVLQMIAVGEESGQVDTLLTEVAEFYEREVEYDLKSLSAKIEPVMITLMAGFVLIMALGIFLPMWEMYNIQQ